MNARDPLLPLQPDEASAIAAFAERSWDEQIVPALTDYIAIPAKSPMFDADWAAHGITVNAIAPGPFLTDMPGKLLNDEEKQYFADRTALKRWAAPRELAGPALMLASEAGAYITGQGIVVDGGAAVNVL